MTATLAAAGRWFLVITGELVVLFLAVTFLVGLITNFLPPEKVQSALGRKNAWAAAVLAAAFGALTPFCSCSTIPILAGMLGAGVPFGAASAFLIASPLLNPVILTMMATILGPATAAVYTTFVFPLSVLSGRLWERAGLAADVKRVRIVRDEENGGASLRPTGPLAAALAFALSLFRQVLPYLLAGAAVGAFIYGFVPQELVVRLAGPHNPLAIPVAAALGVPMYIRAETIIPIGAVLAAKGMSMGAVVALLIGGAGASIPELTLLGSLFRRRTVAAFALTVFLVAVATGLAVEALG